MLIDHVKAIAHRLGVDPKRWSLQTSPALRRGRLLRTARIDLVLDVGANDGRFARELRTGGYQGRIISFEPVQEAFTELARRARRDTLWECRRLALGASDGEAEIHVAGNTEASSFLPIARPHLEAMPDAAYVSTQRVPMARLDSLMPELADARTRPFLKLDVQGFEGQVLEGGRNAISGLAGIETELSLVHLYDGQKGFRELVDELEAAGFALMALEPHFFDPRTGRTLQVDGIFLRADSELQLPTT